MEFKINPAAYANMFPVPSFLVDDNIRLASAVQLKAALYLYRHAMAGENVTCAQIAKATGYSEEDIVDAMIFWVERGAVIKFDEQAPALNPIPSVPAATQNAQILPQTQVPAEEKKTVPVITASKPSHEQIAIRCTECEQFKQLFAEAQQKLGKTIGYEGQATLIMLHDSYGLPIEVILMLIEYAVSKGKTGYSYLANLGKVWAEREIDSYEAAEAYIEEQNSTDSLWNRFRSLTGVKNANPTTKQRRFFSSWNIELGFDCDMIYLAYEISIEKTEKMSLAYMDKVLKNWHSKGIKTPVDVQNEQEQWANSKKPKQTKAKEQSSSSYDLAAFAKKGLNLKFENK